MPVKTDYAPVSHYIQHQTVAYRPKQHMPQSFLEQDSLQRPVYRRWGMLAPLVMGAIFLAVLAWKVAR